MAIARKIQRARSLSSQPRALKAGPPGAAGSGSLGAEACFSPSPGRETPLSRSSRGSCSAEVSGTAVLATESGSAESGSFPGEGIVSGMLRGES